MNFALLLTFKLVLLWLYFGKSWKTTLFRKPAEVSQNTSTFISIGCLLQNNNLLKVWKICEKIEIEKIADIWNFQWIKYLGKDLSYLKKWGIEINYIWNYGASKLLLHFVEYRLDQRNSKHTEIAVNSAIQRFEGCSQNKCLLKVWSCSTKWKVVSKPHIRSYH